MKPYDTIKLVNDYLSLHDGRRRVRHSRVTDVAGRRLCNIDFLLLYAQGVAGGRFNHGVVLEASRAFRGTDVLKYFTNRHNGQLARDPSGTTTYAGQYGPCSGAPKVRYFYVSWGAQGRLRDRTFCLTEAGLKRFRVLLKQIQALYP